ncbi:MAG: hypothetical protein DDT37_00492 [Firmicutes bacterium]|nr:hypothetical protein [candidate division NPL-UPA2 bacterium]
MKNRQTLMLVETAVMVAFAYVLSLFRVVEMPQGGSVSLAMLPIFVIVSPAWWPGCCLAALSS